MIPENALKNAAFYVKYKEMISSLTESDKIILKTLEPVSAFRKLFKSPTIDEVPKLTTHKQSFKFFAEFIVFLNENIGAVSKRLL